NDFPRVSDDATRFAMLTDFDKVKSRGTLIAGTLVDGASQTVMLDTGTAFGFARGANDLMFLRTEPSAQAGVLGVFKADGSQLTVQMGVLNAGMRSGPATLYYTITAPVPPMQAGIYWQPFP